MDESAEACFFGGLRGRTQMAGCGGERVVVPRRIRRLSGAVEQRGEGVEFIGGPRCVACVLARSVLGERVEGGVHAALLLVAGEDLAGGDEVVGILL